MTGQPSQIQTKGPRNGPCNICGEIGDLTEDHNPPKGISRPRAVEVQAVLDRFNLKRHKQRPMKSPNGLKYRTLCKTCNNVRLGSRFDKELIRFVNEVSKLVRSGLILPEIPVMAKPQMLMRSVLGHMSAQCLGGYNEGPIVQAVKRYILDDSEPLPSSIKLYYWLWPYQYQVHLRDVGMLSMDVRQQGSVVVWLTKFYPIAFMAVFDTPPNSGWDFRMLSLESFGHLSIQETVPIPFRFQVEAPQVWPELPQDPYPYYLLQAGGGSVLVEYADVRSRR